MVPNTHLFAPSPPFQKSVCLAIEQKISGEVIFKATTPSIAHRHFRTFANIYHIDSDSSSALIMDSCNLDLHGLAYVAAMEARAIPQKMKPIKDPYVAEINQNGRSQDSRLQKQKTVWI
jgi:hypothetical protein